MTAYKLNTARLIECRQQLGITKIEAARRIGISQPAYLRYESGERTPSLQVIKEIAYVFHTSADYLTGISDSPKVNSYIVRQDADPELFSWIQTYYHSDAEQLARLRAYLEKFHADSNNSEN